MQYLGTGRQRLGSMNAGQLTTFCWSLAALKVQLPRGWGMAVTAAAAGQWKYFNTRVSGEDSGGVEDMGSGAKGCRHGRSTVATAAAAGQWQYFNARVSYGKL